MSKRRSHTSTIQICPRHNKKCLVDRIQAELLLENIQLHSRREIHTEKRAHPCEFGYGWHLTSEEARSHDPGYRHSA